MVPAIADLIMGTYVRHYAAAGFHFRVTSDYPIFDHTFDSKFGLFESLEPESIDVDIYHHFSTFDFCLLEKKSRVFSFEYLDVYVDSNKYFYVQKKSRLYEVRYNAVAVFNSSHSECHVFIEGVTKAEYGRSGFESLLCFGADHYLFSRILIPQKGLMLHANALAYNGEGIILVGRSGKGKSTLSGMLKKNGFSIISEDRAIIKKQGYYNIYGSWCHGSVPNVSNQVIPLKYVFLLEHSEHNSILSLGLSNKVLEYILPCIVKPFADKSFLEVMLSTIEAFTREANFYIVNFNLDGTISKLIKDRCEKD